MDGDARLLFLRAVNLGRRNRVPMKELVETMARTGLGETSYLLHSGNLYCRRPLVEPPQLARQVERVVRDRFGVETRVITRSRDELAQLLAEIPFEAPEGGSVQIAMWDEEPDQSGARMLAQEDFAPDCLQLRPREAIIRYAATSHASRLGNALIERRLKVASTLRNLKTLERLLALPE